MLTNFNKISIAAAAAVAVLGWSAMNGQAHATMITPASSSNGEPGVYQIMNSIYGAGNWMQAEQEWLWHPAAGSSYTASFEVRYAADPGVFGFVPSGGSASTDIMSFDGSGATVLKSSLAAADTAGNGGSTFTWTYTEKATGALFSSDPTKNGDAFDHLIGFYLVDKNGSIADADGRVTLVLAWEDLFGGGDRDYNDAVIEIVYSPPGVTRKVPEPATAGMLGVALIALGAWRMRRRLPV